MPTFSNSFNFIIDKQMNLDKKNEICKTLLDAESFIRTICLKKGGKYLLCYTDTKDFSEQEIFELKYIYEQIYIQSDNSLYIMDFQNQLKKLRITDRCKKCKKRYNCPSIWEIIPEDLFERCERYIKNVLKSLKGDILDIGCGADYRYKDIFLANEMINTYVGVDPDKDAIKSCNKIFGRKREFVFINSRIERAMRMLRNFEFDSILLLRSLNHIRDTRGLLSDCITLLKSGGELILVDNIPFGLVREKWVVEEIKKIKNPKTHFEHYHNYYSSDIIPLLKSLGLILIRHKSVNTGTANQWMIIACNQ